MAAKKEKPETKRAEKRESKKVEHREKATKTETIAPKKAGQKPIKFQRGGLHESTGTPQGKPIPASKKAAALRGDLGPKAKKQAQFAKNVLTGGRKK